MIIHPAKFNAVLKTAIPLPKSGDLAIEEALRKLAEIIERDPTARAVAKARRERRSGIGHSGACAGY